MGRCRSAALEAESVRVCNCSCIGTQRLGRLADAGTGCGRAGPELSVNRGEPRRADSGGWRVAPLPCAVAVLAHVVSDEAAAAGIADRSGTYTALCGHRVHAAALICAS